MRRRVRFIALFALALSAIGGRSIWAQSCYGTSDPRHVNVMCDTLMINDTSEVRMTLMRSICGVIENPDDDCVGCTGTLINSLACANGEPKAYVVTGVHCIGDAMLENRLDSLRFVFNYVDTICSDTGDNRAFGSDTVVGARLLWRAASPWGDAVLLELNRVPSPAPGAFYAGWSRDTTDFTGGIFLGHPAGDAMKMAIDTHTVDFYPSDSACVLPGHVVLWDIEAGAISGGNSGGSLFNLETSRVVAYCAENFDICSFLPNGSTADFRPVGMLWDIPNLCCRGMTGNVDQSLDGLVTASDLAILIDHLYGSLTPLVCTPAGNTDGSSDGLITMGDLSAMIDYLYITLTPLPQCDSVPRPSLGELLDPNGTDSMSIQGYDPVDSTYEYCE